MASETNLDMAIMAIEPTFNIKTTADARQSIKSDRKNSDEVSSFFQRRQELDVLQTSSKSVIHDTINLSPQFPVAMSMAPPSSLTTFQPIIGQLPISTVIETRPIVSKESIQDIPAEDYESNTTQSSSTRSFVVHSSSALSDAPPPLPLRKPSTPPVKARPVPSEPAEVVTEENDDKVLSQELDSKPGIYNVEDAPMVDSAVPLDHSQSLIPSAMRGPPKNIASIINLTDVFTRLDHSGILRCKLFRKKSMLGKGPPTYFLHNEANNSFLLAAKKVLLSKQVTYVISDHPEDITKDSPHYVAKLKANFMRTQFILSDTRRPSKPREIACVTYVLEIENSPVEQKCTSQRIKGCYSCPRC